MINFEQLKKIYQIGRDLQFRDAQKLISASKNRTYKANDYLIQEGSVRREVFYIKKGLVRSFTINDKGDEITLALFWEHHIVVSPDIILFNQASRFYFQALEPTEVLYLDYDVLQNIIDSNPKLSQNRKFIFQRVLRESYKRIESFVLYSPEERYIRYVAENPDIVNRVPNKYIANVLGITPVSLSRIRKRIAAKKKSEKN